MNRLLKIVFNNPLKTIILFTLLVLVSGVFTLQFMSINTSTESLIDENLNFKLNQKELKNEFKVLQNNILIRVKGKKLVEVEDITEKILGNIKKKENAINFAYSPNLDSFFKNNFFYFLNESQKKKLVDQLYDYQPFLSEINNNPRLKGFNNLLELALKEENKLEKFNHVLSKFTESIERRERVDWLHMMKSGQVEFFVVVGLKKKYLEENGFDKFYQFLTNLKNLENDRIKIEFTGGLIVDYEEISSVLKGASLAGLLSIFLVGLILWFSFRNLRIIFSIIITILFGLIITMGLATLFVGTLNLISVAFAVLFIGLSVDFGIQICTRIIEDSKTLNFKKKIENNVLKISNTLFLAATPSIIGFISFIPTSYIGLSELGIISCIGLVVGLLSNILLLPSILLFSPTAFKKEYIRQRFFVNYSELYFKIFSYKKLVFGLFFLLSLTTILLIDRISFDSDALNLKDQKLSSVKLAKELIEKNPTSDYIISAVVKNLDNIDLESIINSENISSYYFLNIKQETQSSDDLEYLKFLLSVKNTDFHSNIDELRRLKNLLIKISDMKKTNVSIRAQDFLTKINDLEKSDLSFAKLENLLFFNFDSLINFVMKLNEIDKNFFDTIPNYYKERYVSDSGLKRIEFFPEKDVSEKHNLKTFVDDVSKFFPKATGMPVVQYKAGEVVLDSFLMAFLISFTFLLIFISFVFKNLKLVFSCLFSLLVATIMTLGSMIFLNLNFNFANMISLPLLYSLGISYPIYFLKRFQEKKDVKKVISSQTPKAIYYSAFTTIASFGTLGISNHNGTSSMGILLFLSLFMTLISALVFLPLTIDSKKTR